MERIQDLIMQNTPVLVDFYAEWCGPCKTMKPVLEDVKRAVGDRARILKVDVDRNRPLASQLNIQAVPTLVLYKQGQVVWRQSGVVSSRELTAIINKYVTE